MGLTFMIQKTITAAENLDMKKAGYMSPAFHLLLTITLWHPPARVISYDRLEAIY